LTKSVTACCIFGLSDFLAQRLEGSNMDGDKDKKPARVNYTRMISSMLVGLLYFGPAAHAWYAMIFKLLPETSLISTLQKAALGQLIFGPSFTCVFFGTSLLQSRDFSLTNWWRKIKTDLPGAWAAGLGFWPLVDLVSYSMISQEWIPLFVNACSLIWTIYLSLIANRQSKNA
jgi:protein Mpv17